MEKLRAIAKEEVERIEEREFKAKVRGVDLTNLPRNDLRVFGFSINGVGYISTMTILANN